MDDLGAYRLMNAIVAQAMSDYVQDRTEHLRHGSKARHTKYNTIEVKQFLRSGWGEALLFGVDADYLTREADKIAKERAEGKKTRIKLTNTHFITQTLGRKMK